MPLLRKSIGSRPTNFSKIHGTFALLRKRARVFPALIDFYLTIDPCLIILIKAALKFGI